MEGTWTWRGEVSCTDPEVFARCDTGGGWYPYFSGCQCGKGVWVGGVHCFAGLKRAAAGRIQLNQGAWPKCTRYPFEYVLVVLGGAQVYERSRNTEQPSGPARAAQLDACGPPQASLT